MDWNLANHWSKNVESVSLLLRENSAFEGRLPVVRITTNLYVETNKTIFSSLQAFFLQETRLIAEEFDAGKGLYTSDLFSGFCLSKELPFLTRVITTNSSESPLVQPTLLLA